MLISSLEFASTPRPADKNDPRHDDQGGETNPSVDNEGELSEGELEHAAIS
jgi:hypothetical protein